MACSVSRWATGVVVLLSFGSPKEAGGRPCRHGKGMASVDSVALATALMRRGRRLLVTVIHLPDGS